VWAKIRTAAKDTIRHISTLLFNPKDMIRHIATLLFNPREATCYPRSARAGPVPALALSPLSASAEDLRSSATTPVS